MMHAGKHSKTTGQIIRGKQISLTHSEDRLTTLPVEILVHIVLYLDVKEFIRLWSVRDLLYTRDRIPVSNNYG